MSEALAESIALWIIIPAVGGIFVLMIITAAAAVGPPRFVRRRRRERQFAELDSLRSESQGHALELDWLRFKDLSYTEIRDVLGGYGWQYEGEEINSRSWLLRFQLQPAVHDDQNLNARLRTELEQASPDISGNYLLDTARYASLEAGEIKEAVSSTGWVVAEADHGAADRQLRLARAGSAPLASHDRTFVHAESPDELRGDPAVAARAKELQHKHGFDPLSEQELARVRQRHSYWQKKFGRQVLLASFYVIVLLILGLYLLSAGADWDGGSSYVMVAVPAILLVLTGIAVYKAVRIRKARRADIGTFLDAYEELNRLGRGEQSVPPSR